MTDTPDRPGPGHGPVTMVALTLGVVLALVAGWILWDRYGPEDPDPCGPGLHTTHGECIGVSDGGGTPFMDDLAEVMKRVKEENDRIDGQPHVTIALMIPMTSDHEPVRRQILHEVQGAYIAQYFANGATASEKQSGGEQPKIRLVLANPGKNRDRWRPVADQLAALSRDKKHNLRTVFGFDLSVRPTAEAIAYLTKEKKIPVVGGPITGDEFTGYPLFARVAPTNSDQADALVHFDRNLDLEHAILVKDTRPSDPYNESLLQAYEGKLRRSPHEPMPFESEGTDAEGALAGEFKRMATDICVLRPQVNTVYFAGRPTHLRQFLNELARNRPCKNEAFTVVSGSGASTLYADTKLDWDALRGLRGDGGKWEGKVTVLYTSVSHPDGWLSKRPRPPETGGSPAVVRELMQRLAAPPPVGPIGPADIYDSRTVSVHDSAKTAIAGIRLHAEGRKSGYIPTLREIGTDWNALRGVHKVDGASGWICIDNKGNAYNKAVAVVRLDPEVRGERPTFVGLAWPKASPPPMGQEGSGACQIPRS
ncbi:ABC transporter substrate-binding protein [Streptomyces sp. NPDC006307]|uniref:ABC transporter substrate-binding protein n=1 Tax=Streptomyces sp. NPDC006307 TaxID=3156748 RepID=UPI0033A02F31